MHSRTTWAQRAAFAALIGLGLLVAGWVGFLWAAVPPKDATAAELLGVALPASAGDERLAIQRRGLGEFRAFVRFTLDPADLPALLADPAFQPLAPSDRPLDVFANAAVGSAPLAQIVARDRPDWWRPEDGARFALAYRSLPGPGAARSGPDAAWYIVDTSDSRRAVVYVYVLEV